MTQIISDPNERFKLIIKQSLNPIMKKEGFKKSGVKYKLMGENLLYEIYIQKSKWNTKEHLSFTINFWIWLKEERTEILPFPFLAPILGGRISDIYNNRDMWFDLKLDDQKSEEMDKKIEEKIKFLLIDYLIPFFKKIQTEDDIISILEDPIKSKISWGSPAGGQKEKWLAILYYMKSKKEKSIEILDEAMKKYKVGDVFRNTLETLKEKMLSR